jgi:hypothetical protein
MNDMAARLRGSENLEKMGARLYCMGSHFAAVA